MNNNNAKLYSILEAQNNNPVKTTHLQFDNFEVGANNEAFSFAHDVSNVRSMTICGFNSGSADSLCYVELWFGNIDDSSSFLSPQSRGEFSNGLLYFGNIPIAANFVKLRIINNDTTAHTFTVRYYMST